MKIVDKDGNNIASFTTVNEYQRIRRIMTKYGLSYEEAKERKPGKRGGLNTKYMVGDISLRQFCLKNGLVYQTLLLRARKYGVENALRAEKYAHLQ